MCWLTTVLQYMYSCIVVNNLELEKYFLYIL